MKHTNISNNTGNSLHHNPVCFCHTDDAVGGGRRQQGINNVSTTFLLNSYKCTSSALAYVNLKRDFCRSPLQTEATADCRHEVSELALPTQARVGGPHGTPSPRPPDAAT